MDLGALNLGALLIGPFGKLTISFSVLLDIMK